MNVIRSDEHACVLIHATDTQHNAMNYDDGVIIIIVYNITIQNHCDTFILTLQLLGLKKN